MMLGKYYTPKEAREYLELKKSHFTHFLNKGLIKPYAKLGIKFVYTKELLDKAKEDIEKYINKNRIDTTLLNNLKIKQEVLNNITNNK